MPQSCDMGPMALLPLQRKACWGFFCPGVNQWTWVPKASMLTTRPPKLLILVLLLSQLSAGPAMVDLEVKQVPFATLYTRPPDDGLQMGLKHVERHGNAIKWKNSASCWFIIQTRKKCLPAIEWTLKSSRWGSVMFHTHVNDAAS
jgi:hypothetical protein